MMRYLVRKLSMGALAAALIVSIAACNNQTGFSGSIGNTPNGPPLPSFQILGTNGTPFTATVFDTRSTWTVQGVVPIDMIICNIPAGSASTIIVTKTVSNNNLLSLEILKGNHVVDLQSTTAPDGTVSVQTGGGVAVMPPHANPDLRIFDSGPRNERYQALIEDVDTGFVIQSRAPTLIFFDNPDGKVDGTFFGGQDFGTFKINMTLDGVVVASVKEGPDATIREP